MPHRDLPDILTVGEVAALFRVDPKTVSRWAIGGKIRAMKTPGGHRRFRREDVLAHLDVPHQHDGTQIDTL